MSVLKSIVVDLATFAARAPFDLDGFVEAANALLPQFLPDQLRGGARFSPEINVRLVRHLASLGLLDESERAGREARYQMRHLLQLLAVRRLMAEGHTTTAIKTLTAGATDEQLTALLRGETRAGLFDDAPEFEAFASAPASSNAALDFLRKIGSEAAPVSKPARRVPTSSPSAPSAPSPSWRRVEIAPGLELHLREDFAAPATPHERELLLQRLEAELKTVAKRARRR